MLCSSVDVGHCKEADIVIGVLDCAYALAQNDTPQPESGEQREDGQQLLGLPIARPQVRTSKILGLRLRACSSLVPTVSKLASISAVADRLQQCSS